MARGMVRARRAARPAQSTIRCRPTSFGCGRRRRRRARPCSAGPACAALRALVQRRLSTARPKRRLPALGGGGGGGDRIAPGRQPARPPDRRVLDAIRGKRQDLADVRAPRKTIRPSCRCRCLGRHPGRGGRRAQRRGGRRRRRRDPVRTAPPARRRRPSDQSQRDDPLLLHRFETILSLAEMVNVNRSVEDDDEEGARQAADDLPELTIGSHRKRASTRLKLDLDLAPAEAEAEPVTAEISYPEWDWKRRRYHPRLLPRDRRAGAGNGRGLGAGRGHAAAHPPGAPAIRGAAAAPPDHDAANRTATISISRPWCAMSPTGAPAAPGRSGSSSTPAPSPATSRSPC